MRACHRARDAAIDRRSAGSYAPTRDDAHAAGAGLDAGGMELLPPLPGPGRLVVLPPSASAHAPERLAIAHGAAAWWASMLSRFGRETTWLLEWVSHGPNGLDRPHDDDVRTQARRPGVEARFALLPEYGARTGEPVVLLAARLVEVSHQGSLRVLGDWAFEPTGRIELDIVDSTFELLLRVADAMGLHCPYEGWREAFSASLPGPAVAFLRAIGTVELLSRGHRSTDRTTSLRALVRAIHRAPRMRDAIDLFPRLTLAALEDPAVDEHEVEDIWREACSAVAERVPAAWTRIPELMRTRTDDDGGAFA